MADEIRAILSTGKALKLGEEVWPVVGDVVPPTFVDLIAEARHHNGTVCLSLHSVLGNIIRDATKPAGKDKAN